VLEVHDLPTLNAALNTIAATLLVIGRRAIRRGNLVFHRRCMLAACATSTLFLAGYLLHKKLAGMTYFEGTGVVRTVYFTILTSHTILAVAIVPLVATTLVFALRNSIARHKRLAKITWPLWLYVSVTGVVIWWMLYSGTFMPRPGASP
jgi:uncharacterized membrane protein YozB (DUF420 family)